MFPRALRHASLSVALTAFLGAACYSTGNGVEPPPNDFYFPVGLAVSRGGNVLYAVNSNFDLQWNAGTIQSYDLHLIRKHALVAIQDPKNAALPFAVAGNAGQCPAAPAVARADGTPTASAETCAPIVRSSFYVRDSAHVGAFATDLQILDGRRLFFPVRGSASVTWADIAADDPAVAPPEDAKADYAPFRIDCGTRDASRCNPSHEAGSNGNEVGNSRHVTMPGEPFGFAFSEDGEAAIVTHQSDAKASLFSTGIVRGTAASAPPSLQFVLDQVAGGGNGVAAIPHCFLQPNGAPCAANAPRPSFLLTSRESREIGLLRYYSDDASGGASVRRPFLQKETAFSLNANLAGTDSRGVAVDPTPRMACLSRIDPSSANAAAATARCNETPSRVFIANRSPASLVYGEIGTRGTAEAAPNPDKLNIAGTIPLSNGPSRVFLGPVVDRNGRYALRVFVICFDASMIYVIDPELLAVENILRIAPGPYALAFDPFRWEDVAKKELVPIDPREPNVKNFRFGYLASFTQSFVQVLDLDSSSDHPASYQTVVLQLGKPTNPKGSF